MPRLGKYKSSAILIPTAAYSDSHGDTNEQHEDAEIDVDGSWLIFELVVQAHSNGTSQAKGNGHAKHSNAQHHLPIAHQKTQIHLQSYYEQEEHEPEICNEVELRHGHVREYGIPEAGYAAHDGGAQQNASYDLGDDARLADFGERPF